METESNVLGFKEYFSNQLLQTCLKIKLNPDLLIPLLFWFRFFRALYKLLKHANAIQEELRTFLWFSCLFCSSSLSKHIWIWICFSSCKENFCPVSVVCKHPGLAALPVCPHKHGTALSAFTSWHTKRLTKSAENIRVCQRKVKLLKWVEKQWFWCYCFSFSSEQFGWDYKKW